MTAKIKVPRTTIYTRKGGRKTVKPEAPAPAEKRTPKKRNPASTPAVEPIPMGD